MSSSALASASAATTATQSRARGPLSHIVDALRLDNRHLLLEALRSDPRSGHADDDRRSHGRGADSAAGGRPPDDKTSFGADGSGRDGDATASGSGDSSVVVEQQLIFGSADLRRVILRQVMHRDHRQRDARPETRKGKKKQGKKNLTQVQEEEEIMNDWNEEMKQPRGDGREIQIVGTHVLSPLGDGSIINPHHQAHPPPSSLFPSQSKNPFAGESDPDGTSGVQITSYILRGGGFDLPSLSLAALHRRRALAGSSQGNRFHSPHPSHRGGHDHNQKLFRFIFVPRMTEVERAFLSGLGVEGDTPKRNAAASGSNSFNSLESLPIDLVPLDDDVLSLELTGGNASVPCDNYPDAMMNESDKSGGGTGSALPPPPSAACMRHADIEGCDSDVADIVARSLIKLQLLNQGVTSEVEGSSLRGSIARVQGLGPLATAVIDRMMILRLEEERNEARAAEEDQDDNEQDTAEREEVSGSREGMDQDEVVNAVDGVEITTNNNNGHETGSGKSRIDEGIDGDVMGTPNGPTIRALLVIDRKIDLVTPMLTPLTYEGLVDDVFQIQVGGCVAVKKSIVEPDDDEDGTGEQRTPDRRLKHNPTILLPLNDSDPLYSEVRNLHVETFGQFLQNQAVALRESHSQFTSREGATARDLSEIHRFVKQIPVFTRNLRSLTNHIHVAEMVKSAAEATAFRARWQTERSMLESETCYEVLEDLIASGESPYRWLRLFCLQSLTSNGIKAARYDSLRREVVQTYGYEFLIVLNDLEKAGFLRRKVFMDSMVTPYSTLRKALNLIVADVDPSSPEDAAYVSSGYAPATVRWVQASMRGYSGLEEAMKELPGGGRLVDIEQRWPPESLVEALKRKRGPSLGTMAKKWADEDRGRASRDSEGFHGFPQEMKKPILLIYFVGGVTFMELAALRFLSSQPFFPYSIVCCTTEIVNGGTLLRSLSC